MDFIVCTKLYFQKIKRNKKGKASFKMEEVKKLFKITITVTIIFFLLGLILQDKYLLFGVSCGCAISVIALYMLSLDSKAISYTKDVKTAKRIAYIGYAKRYFLHLLFLGAILYFTNDFKIFLSGFIGTLNVKLSIYFMSVFKKIKSFFK